MNYIRYSEQYYKQAPYDWIKRVLKFHENVEGENTLKSRYGHFTSVSSGNSPRALSGPGRIYNIQQEKKQSRYCGFCTILNFINQTYFSHQHYMYFYSYTLLFLNYPNYQYLPKSTKLVIDIKKLEKPKDTEEILKKNFSIFK